MRRLLETMQFQTTIMIISGDDVYQEKEEEDSEKEVQVGKNGEIKEE